MPTLNQAPPPEPATFTRNCPPTPRMDPCTAPKPTDSWIEAPWIGCVCGPGILLGRELLRRCRIVRLPPKGGANRVSFTGESHLPRNQSPTDPIATNALPPWPNSPPNIQDTKKPAAGFGLAAGLLLARPLGPSDQKVNGMRRNSSEGRGARGSTPPPPVFRSNSTRKRNTSQFCPFRSVISEVGWAPFPTLKAWAGSG